MTDGSQTPSISQAEWEVMEVIWDESPILASTVVERLIPQRDWSPRTIKTMLNRLVRKGALHFEVHGKRYLYRPAVSRQQCIQRKSRSFLKWIFGGSRGAMLAQFVRDSSLSEDDIAELRKILDEKQEGKS
ncbi:MAG TPA: BlaI/MecI/CopY family transcriptional regulator [Phycisphaerae bacterium]|nr:BlaI/MecI/CopY family transcriptional regulator [Phycisphaerae bacterium]